MKNLIQYFKQRTELTEEDIILLNKSFQTITVPPQTKLLEAGSIEKYVYFISSGILKGYQNMDGKFIVQHLVGEFDFFTSLESFYSETVSQDYFETITDCTLLRVSKSNFDLLKDNTSFWSAVVTDVTNEHLNRKQDRLKDFQTLTAKERYIKFLASYPDMVLNVSIDNIASFLGIEPQSLSRIRKQIAF